MTQRATVVRIIRYEGPLDRVRDTIARSMGLGIHEKGDLTITISEHESNLPEVDCLCPSAVADTLSKARPVVTATALVPGSPFMDAKIEAKAIEIYDGWKDLQGWVPWVTNGISSKQDHARRLAREFYEKAE